jgi:hypothetical protein
MLTGTLRQDERWFVHPRCPRWPECQPRPSRSRDERGRGRGARWTATHIRRRPSPVQRRGPGMSALSDAASIGSPVAQDYCISNPKKRKMRGACLVEFLRMGILGTGSAKSGPDLPPCTETESAPSCPSTVLSAKGGDEALDRTTTKGKQGRREYDHVAEQSRRIGQARVKEGDKG